MQPTSPPCQAVTGTVVDIKAHLPNFMHPPGVGPRGAVFPFPITSVLAWVLMHSSAPKLSLAK